MTPLEQACAELESAKELRMLWQTTDNATSKAFRDLINNTDNRDLAEALEEAEELRDEMLQRLTTAVGLAEDQAALEDQRERFRHEDSYRWAGV